LESAVPESGDRLVITEPRDGQQLIDESGIGRVIDIAGRLDPSAIKPGRVVEVVIHTDIDYPQGEVSPAPDGTWRHEWNHLGGSTHRIFAVLRENDEPLFRSAVVTVDVVRRS
jgi:hypothetical protein